MTIGLFNNKAGVGTTMVTYHLGAMLADLGARVLMADLDPQANLTSMCFDDEALEELWLDDLRTRTIYRAVADTVLGGGDIRIVEPSEVPAHPNLGLLPGDLALSAFEEEFARAWPGAMIREPDSLRSTTSLWRAVSGAAETWRADIVLIDAGSNLGALTRAAMICADHIVVPLAPDVFCVQSLKNIGGALCDWRNQWSDRRSSNLDAPFSLPHGLMEPLGYVVLQPAVRLDRPVLKYGHWLRRLPDAYASYVLGRSDAQALDTEQLAHLKNYRSLAPLAKEAKVPMFSLRSGDGALGAQREAVRSCYDDFKLLAGRIGARVGFTVDRLRKASTT